MQTAVPESPAPHNKAALFLLVVLMLCVAGCRPPAGALRPPPARAVPENTLAALAAADRFDGAFQALARIELSGNRGAYPLKAAILMRWPDALRVEHLPLLGPPDFFMTLAGSRLQISVPGEKAYWTGAPTRENLASFLPIGLSGGELIALLRGSCPPGEGITSVQTVAEADGDAGRLDLFAPDGKRLTLWTDPTSRHVQRCTRFAEDGREVYTVRFEDHRLLSGRPWPMRIRFTAPGPPATVMTVRYTDPILSPDADPERFDLPIPPGTLPRRLPEGPP